MKFNNLMGLILAIFSNKMVLRTGLPENAWHPPRIAGTEKLLTHDDELNIAYPIFRQTHIYLL